MPNVLCGRFRTGRTCPLRTFAPGQCIPASAIMQFRRNVYEYSMKNSTHHFRMQSECEQTVVATINSYFYNFIQLVIVSLLSLSFGMNFTTLTSCSDFPNIFRSS